MELKKQVCSLELAKRLKELGAAQSSYFWWEHVTEIATSTGVQKADYWRITNGAMRTPFIAAFTVAELGEMLPQAFQSGKRPYNSVSPKEHPYECYPYAPVHGNHIPTQTARTEADARAKMLIYLYLLENKLIGGTARGT